MNKLINYLPHGDTLNNEITHKYLTDERNDILTYGDHIFIKSAYEYGDKQFKPSYSNIWNVYYDNDLILSISPYERGLAIGENVEDQDKMGSATIYILLSDNINFQSTHYHYFNEKDMNYMYNYFFLEYFCYTNLIQQIRNLVCRKLGLLVQECYFSDVGKFHDDRIYNGKNIVRPELLMLYREICDLKKNGIIVELYGETN